MNFWDWLYFLTMPELVQPILLLLGISLFIVGAIIAMAASKVISVSTVADMRTDREPELITDGVYSRLRHPLYLATILILIALIMLYPFPTVILFSIGLSVYTLMGAYFEERKLILFYGDKYLEYKKTAGFILPKIRR
jgi:protein-S-isoprenylcysteine O-methyltransferase Ste14